MEDYIDLDQMEEKEKTELDSAMDMDRAYGFSKNADRDPDDHVPVMRQDAPQGMAQGDRKKNWLAESFNSEHTDQEEDVADDNVQAKGPVEDVARKADDTKNPSQEFRNWVDELLRSEKGGLFGGRNSDRFERVHQALVDAVGAFMGSFGTDSARNINMLMEAQTACNALLAACQQYTSRKPKTPAGKARRKMVLQIQALAAKDALGLGDAITDFCGLSPEEQSGHTWASVLGKARSVSLTVDDFSKQKRASGGQVSQVFMVQGKYFKPEDSLNVDGGVGKEAYNSNWFIALSETLERYPKLSQDDREALEYIAEKPGSEHSLSKEGVKAYTYLCGRAEELRVLVNEVMKPQGIVDEGGMANTTRRNVATSRMAELLGLGHLVAKSQTAEIQEQKTGKIIRGNLMDQAEGVEYSEVAQMIQANNKPNKENVAGVFTASAARDITSLQVLDMLCGQVDRHGKNMLYKTNAAGQISGIQGIDNDASFGTNVDAVSAKDPGRKDARVFDFRDGGKMVLPYMDKALADRIEQLDSSVVRYVLSDLLKEAEIEATIQRLENMKAGIARAKKDEEYSKHFLENETDWTEDVMKQMVHKHRDMSVQWTNERYDNDAFKEMVEKVCTDKDLREAIILSKTNINKFNETYTGQQRTRILAARDKVLLIQKKYLDSKYSANVNYLGRLFFD